MMCIKSIYVFFVFFHHLLLQYLYAQLQTIYSTTILLQLFFFNNWPGGCLMLSVSLATICFHSTLDLTLLLHIGPNHSTISSSHYRRYSEWSFLVYQIYSLVSWGSRIHRLHFCRGVRHLPPPPTSVLDMTLNNLMVRLQSWRFEEWEVSLHWNCFQIHFGPEG